MLDIDESLLKVLSRLEVILAESGAAIASVLHPGIDESELERRFGGIGLNPTVEVATWFRWRDGAGQPGAPIETIELVPGGAMYDLQRLCEEYVKTRNNAEHVAAAVGNALSPDDLWSSTWFPLLRLFGKGFVAVELGASGGATSSVHVSWHDEEPKPQQAWPTVKAFVQEILVRFDDGTYTVDEKGIVRGPTIDHV